ncbi:amino acid adenylation domain-containing protein [Oceanobacillus kimchii]|uniref:non-ribosomal peptide synthetase n=1 Tax=Oceanobacillus kimchii TaxID=746691 RepID=UPI003B014B8D
MNNAALDSNRSQIIKEKLNNLNKKTSNQEVNLNSYNEFPLSYAQKRIWFSQKLTPHDTTYNITRAFRIEGDLNIQALVSSLKIIIDRHNIFKSRIVDNEEKEPKQIVLEENNYNIKCSDISHDENQELKVKHIIKEINSYSFNLTSDPLYYIEILKLDKNYHYLILNVHHIIFDGMSLTIFFNELNSLYLKFVNGITSNLTQKGIQYSDYCIWEQKQKITDKLNYWSKKLSGIDPLIELTTDKKRPMIKSSNGESIFLDIPKEVYKSVTNISKTHNSTNYMTMLAIFKILLSKYTNSDDITIGTPISTRDSNTKDLIGLFINIVAIRTELQKDMNFNDVINVVRNNIFEAMDNHLAPFEKVVEKVQPTRDPSFSPIFQIEFQTEVPLNTNIKGLDISEEKLDNGKSEYDITFSVTEHIDSLSVQLKYNSELYTEENIRRIINSYFELVIDIENNPSCSIDNLRIVSETEQNKITKLWNETYKRLPADTLIHQLFENKVREMPDAVAIITDEEKLTYRQLNEKSNQLANYLIEQGVKSNKPVVIHMDRSINMIVSILAVLKSGGAFLPIDIDAPKERMRKIINDAEPIICLSHNTYYGNHSDLDMPTLLMDTFSFEKYNSENPNVKINYDNLISIYYTSGSTGAPKGVASTHIGWLNRILWMQNYHKLKPTETVLQKTVLTFDDSAVEIFWPLIVGSRISVLEPELHRDTEAILKNTIKNNVSVIQFVPSVFKMFLKEIDQYNVKKLNSLRTIISSGEELKPELVNLHFSKLPAVNLYNQWGATEVSIDSTVYKCEKTDGNRKAIPVGKPIDNNGIYILDEKLNVVPIGVVGDIYIDGIGLAKGYLNDYEKTNNAFLPHPFDKEGRIYKTGDRGYFESDGNIIFNGREDAQVKIRGVRIELGEIERILNHHQYIKESVILLDNVDNSKKLVAFIIGEDKEKNITLEEVQSYLIDKLPTYMIPNIVIRIEKIPTTPSGKINNKGLLELLDSKELKRKKDYKKPVGKYEIKLVEIWESVLDRGYVSVNDNFFEIGGHSLLAVKVINKIRKEISVDINLRDIFKYPKLEQLANYISNEEKINNFSRIEKNNLNTSFLSHAQLRLWYLYKLNTHSTFYNIPIVKQIEVKKPEFLNLNIFEKAIKKIIERHNIFRTVFIEENEKPKQVILNEIYFQYKFCDISSHASSNIESILKKQLDRENEETFDLTKKPPFKIILYKLNSLNYRLYINIHHIIFDAWSTDVFFKELISIYEDLYEGHDNIDLSETVDYTDYSIWQRNELNKGTWKEQEKYWVNKLEKPLPLLNLPLDNIRPKQSSYKGKLLKSRVNDNLYKKIKKISRELNVSISSVLLSSYVILLNKLTNDNDFIVGTPVSGRNRIDLENTIGFFVNTLPLRISIEQNNNLKDLIELVHYNLLEAFSNQDVPLDVLVKEVDPERDSSRSTLFDTMFYFNENSDESVNNKKLRLSSTNNLFEHNTSKMDLTFFTAKNGNNIELSFEYNTDIFNDQTINRYMKIIQKIIDDMYSFLEVSVSSFEVITDYDRKVYKKMNSNHHTLKNNSIDAMFQKQVDINGDKIAISTKDKTLTYKELDNIANTIAGNINELRNNKPIGIMMERGIDSVVAMLGVLKTGQAYVPIDCKYPSGRIKYIIEQCDIKYVLTENDLNIYNCKTININKLDKRKNKLRIIENSLSSLAYVLFTSGSTGKPKGVMVNHSGVINLVEDWILKQDLGNKLKQEVFLQSSAHTFDVSAGEIWLSLLRGSHLYILSDEERLSVDKFTDIAERLDASMTIMPTAMFHEFAKIISTEQVERIKNWKKIAVCGEALKLDLVKEWWGKGARFDVINLYGPTEATIFVSSFTVKKDEFSCLSQSKIPIGKPINNVSFHILNENMQLCPINVPGELYIESSNNLARGYINDKQKTNQAFLKHPVNKNITLYKTGDIAKLLSTGNIEFIGRNDGQLKIRGHRVETGEIEASILKLPEVNTAAILPISQGEDIKHLVGFYSIDNKKTNNIEILNYLKETLPKYMMPTKLIAIDEFPINSNGKIDRSKLKEEYEKSCENNSQYKLESSETEEKIMDIWKSLLNIRSLDKDNSFFELGGHSLLVIHLVNRINKQFFIDINMNDIFDYPTFNEMYQLVERNIRKRSKTEHNIPKIEEDDDYELSHSQKRMWWLQNILDNKNSYDVIMMYKYIGNLEVVKFEQVIRKIVDSHEILRTVFLERNGEVRQKVYSQSSFKLDYLDFSGLATDNLDEFIDLKLKDLESISFELDKLPLFKIALFKCKDEEYKLYLNMHHIITDMWSIDLFLEELEYYYINYNEDVAKEPIRVTYKDYAYWQNSIIKEGKLESQRKYWLEELSKPLPALELPLDRGRKEEKGFNNILKANLPISNLKLKKVCEENNTTPFNILFSGYVLMLSYVMKQKDIIIGTPVSGRNNSNLENVMGFFVNTLPIRFNLNNVNTLRDLLDHCSNKISEGYNNADYPFDLIVEDINPDRETNKNPFFNVAFLFENKPSTNENKKMFTKLNRQGEYSASKLDLNLHIKVNNEHLSLSYEYDSFILNKQTISRFHNIFEQIVIQFMTNISQNIHELDLLPKLDKSLYHEINSTQQDSMAMSTSIPHLFKEQAVKRPLSIAISDGISTINYKELDYRSNQLANYLHDKCAGNKKKIAIFMDRSINSIVSMLAILKVGSCYVPIDPSYPIERIKYMILDSDIDFIITDCAKCESLVNLFPINKVMLINKIKNYPIEYQMNESITSESLAYIIYTSGSTGKPKGTTLRHSGVINLSEYTSTFFKEDENVLQFSSHSFDGSVWEIWPTLLNGLHLCIADESSKELDKFIDFISDNKITMMTLPTIFFKQMGLFFNKDDLKKLASIRRIFIAGEKLTYNMFNNWRFYKDKIEFINGYGPTESTVCATTYSIDLNNRSHSIPIGKPINNIKIRIVDEYMNLCPINVIGEILIEAEYSLATSYINKNEKYDEVFLNNRDGYKNTLYRTGDFGKLLYDGSIELTGRKDNQVKILGYRVEKNEIEIALQKIRGLTYAIVITEQDSLGNNKLIAFYQGENINYQYIRRELKNKLPAYMIPSEIIEVNEIPLLPNGKVDKNRLLDQKEYLYSNDNSNMEDSDGELLNKLSIIWGDVLEIPQERINHNRNFFEHGGNSLLLTKVKKMLKDRLGIEITLSELFQYPTLLDLSQMVEGGQGGDINDR